MQLGFGEEGGLGLDGVGGNSVTVGWSGGSVVVVPVIVVVVGVEEVGSVVVL